MSRIGNNPVKLPAKVEVTLAGGEISVKGPLGTLTRTLRRRPSASRRTATRWSSRRRTTRRARCTARCARWSPTWSRASPRATRSKLTLVGVGYRAQAAGDKLNLSLGFSHPVVHQMPKGVKVETPVQTEILVKGIDKQQVGQVAAEIRAYRPPEPYKGKGVRYADERVVIKETKKK